MAESTKPTCGSQEPHSTHITSVAIGEGGPAGYALSRCPGVPHPTRAEAMHAGTIAGPEPCTNCVRLERELRTLARAAARIANAPAQQAPAATGLPCPICFSTETCQHFEASAPAATGDDALADEATIASVIREWETEVPPKTGVSAIGLTPRIAAALRARPLLTEQRIEDAIDRVKENWYPDTTREKWRAFFKDVLFGVEPKST